MKRLLLLLPLLTLGGCFWRSPPIIMYMDGAQGTVVAVPANAPYLPHAAAFPAVGPDGAYPDSVVTGWYLSDEQRWRPQRWRFGGPNSTPIYYAVYP